MSFQLPLYFDHLATLIWASSGALLAARRGFAPLGIATVAIVSSTGGGLLRDGLFLQRTPVLVTSPAYLQLIGMAVLLVFVLGARINRIPRIRQVVSVVDALGLGAYAAVGMCLALEAGMTLLGVVVVGMVNSVGGGILRDVLLRDPVSMFQPGTLEELVALTGCFLFLLLLKSARWPEDAAAWLTIATVFLLRMMAIHFDIRSGPLPGFQPESTA